VNEEEKAQQGDIRRWTRVQVFRANIVWNLWPSANWEILMKPA